MSCYVYKLECVYVGCYSIIVEYIYRLVLSLSIKILCTALRGENQSRKHIGTLTLGTPKVHIFEKSSHFHEHS